MKRSIRTTPSISAGSMADIAFLLLIFFLVATQISEEQGIRVVLPEYYEGPVGEMADRLVLNIKINRDDVILVESELMEIVDLKASIMDFVLNPDQLNDRPPNPGLAVISLQNDVMTTYARYVEVYSVIQSAYRQMRNDLSMSLYGKSHLALDPQEAKYIKSTLPMTISEAEPYSQ